MRRLLPSLVVVLSALRAGAEERPTVLNTTLAVLARTHDGYVKQPKNAYLRSWTPAIEFMVMGPIEPGGQLVADFFDGKKPWVSIDLETPEVAAGKLAPIAGGHQVPNEKGIIATGTFGFQIRLKNELAGSDTVLYKGTFVVDKFAGNPEQKKNGTFEYFVDQDFWLPYGTVWLDWIDPQAPKLRTSMWVRGQVWPGKDVVYLLYEGKPICDSKSDAKAGPGGPTFHNSGGGESRDWQRVDFYFACARAFSTYPPDYGMNDVHLLDKHPGQYEVKLLHEGKLTRSLSFTVGADGKIAQLGVVPVKVLVDTENGQKLDRSAWKTGIYGNPVAGFSP